MPTRWPNCCNCSSHPGVDTAQRGVQVVFEIEMVGNLDEKSLAR